MKRSLFVAMAVTAALLLAANVPAGQKAMQSQQTGEMKGQWMDLGQMEEPSAKDFIGRKVMGKDGEELGKADDLFTTLDGKPMYIVVEDESGKFHPIPAQLLRANTEEMILSAEFDQQTFQSSPSFDEAQLIKQEVWEPFVRGYYQDHAEGQIQELPPKQGTTANTQGK
jgi:hypothetical protein